MRRALLLFFTLAVLARAGEGSDLWKTPGLSAKISAADGRIVFHFQNATADPLTPRVEKGAIFAGRREAQKRLVLRSAEVLVPARGSAEMAIPAAALSSREAADAPEFELEATAGPEFAPLLDYCGAHDDLPAATAQLLVLCVAEDVSFARWREGFAAQRPTPGAPDEVTTAIDALGLLRTLYPRRTFVLAADPELKRRALRSPVARRKAMKLYGLELPDAPLPPDLGTLLHTKVGDNCPICRQRAQMQPREDGL